jgi:hypothetical protein
MTDDLIREHEATISRLRGRLRTERTESLVARNIVGNMHGIIADSGNTPSGNITADIYTILHQRDAARTDSNIVYTSNNIATNIYIESIIDQRDRARELAARLEEELAAATHRGLHDDEHLIEFRDDGWTIQHTLTERLNGTLFDCPLSNWTGGDPGERGRFLLVANNVYGDRIN